MNTLNPNQRTLTQAKAVKSIAVHGISDDRCKTKHPSIQFDNTGFEALIIQEKASVMENERDLSYWQSIRKQKIQGHFRCM